MRRLSGFTLIEVLVAMSIFAIVGLVASQMLRTVIDTRDRTAAVVDTMNDLSRTLMIIERDLGQMVLRPVRDEYGETLPALMVNSGNYPLEFTRTGWNNPLNVPRSSLQRVAYEVDDKERLLRHFWLVLDRAEDSEPVTQTIVTGVKGLRFQLYDEEGDTTDSWPDLGASRAFPAAIEMIIETENLGEISKLQLLPSDPVMSSAGTGNQNDQNDQDEQEQQGDEQTDDSSNTIEQQNDPDGTTGDNQ
ncbi:MAG: type II secretion system minor pseudopilin GspJ [Pseudomonadales bacterium]|nr:type II secretion system minor pseudopilin GspJ [Pseudomonadales bacterium]